MRKFKRAHVWLLSVALTLFALNSYARIYYPPGDGDEAKNKVSSIDCWRDGQITSFGNCCITGGSSCLANLCPSGTDPRSNFCGE